MTPEKRLDQVEPVIGEILKGQDEHTAQNREILYRQDELTGQIREVTRLIIESAVTQSRTKRDLTEQIKKSETQLTERIDGLGERISTLESGQTELNAKVAGLDMKVDLILRILQERN
jgi:phage terminase small subunit